MTYLMLGNSCNLRVNGFDGGAKHAFKPNTSGIALKGSVYKSISLSDNVPGSLCICEGLVGCCLMQAIGIGNFPLAVLAIIAAGQIAKS
jgi:hypothetical protein